MNYLKLQVPETDALWRGGKSFFRGLFREEVLSAVLGPAYG